MAKQLIRKNKPIRVTKSEQYVVNSKYLGLEPDPIINYSHIAYGKALNWYNYMCTIDEAKGYIKDYLKQNNRISESKLISKVPDNKIPTTLGWIARLSTRGSNLPDEVNEFFEQKLKHCLSYAQKTVEKVVEPVETMSVRDRMKERANDIIGEIETIIDSGSDFSAFEWLKKNEIPASYCFMIISHYKPWIEELTEAINAPDSQLKEAYSHFSKNKLKQRLSFMQSIVDDCVKYSDVTKKIKIPRKPRSVSNEKLLKDLKYQKEDKNYKIASVNPEKIIGAQELWTFNTKYKFITLFVAIDKSGLSIKGTSITGYDESKSTAKTTGRKTEEVVSQIYSSNKTASKKIFDTLKNGYFSSRINENTILMKIG